jgi:ATP-dependent protease HslVU (ClpYQ) peptidase subunit
MWLSMNKSEIHKLKKALTLAGYSGPGAHGPFARLRDKLDEVLQDDKNPVLRAYRRRAKKLHKEGELEIDDDAVVSCGDDRGAYVQAWVWVKDEDDDKDK